MQTFADYTVVATIHEGTTSTIYRGVKAGDTQPVILKVLKAAYPTPHDIARLQREYDIARSLDLPGVVAPRALERRGAGVALVMEDFGGVSLAELIPAGLSLHDALHIAISLADTLAAIHQHNIIHKDLKPANIIANLATRQVKITDFGIASRLSRETQGLCSPHILEGTLAYLAPEQTGRMNRVIDFRTDFYALGVTLYEMLTGQLPFQANDVMELVHAHIARAPTAPHLLAPTMPEALSAIVMKLLAKTAEERYQSAYGLKADLVECLRQLETTGQISTLTPGLHDRSDRFQISQRLYGREQELATMWSAFERAGEGQTELLLVTGYAGVGKSVLIQELHKPMTQRRGYCIAGKFDQLKRHIPYSAIIQAFQDLVRQILTESEEQITRWREQLSAALGPNGQIITEIIPDMVLIVGLQPPVSMLPPVEAQNRFNLVFQHFIAVFTQPEHPLALILDDLQWADSASLHLLQTLMSDTSDRSLLLVGSYRDNEVTDLH